jgi:hypothetical protein
MPTQRPDSEGQAEGQAQNARDEPPVRELPEGRDRARSSGGKVTQSTHMSSRSGCRTDHHGNQECRAMGRRRQVMSIQVGDIPTWVAAIGTIGALGAALWQISNERTRRIAQEAQDRSERHQSQARLVAAWIGEIDYGLGIPGDDDGRTAIELLNGSAEPIYSLVTGLVYIQGAAPNSMEAWFELKKQSEPDTQTSPPILLLSILPPGRWRIWIPGSEWGILSGRIGAEVAFTDRAGAHWVRRGTGKLEELSTPPFKHFEAHGMQGPPYDYRIPDPVGYAVGYPRAAE